MGLEKKRLPKPKYSLRVEFQVAVVYRVLHRKKTKDILRVTMITVRIYAGAVLMTESEVNQDDRIES